MLPMELYQSLQPLLSASEHLKLTASIASSAHLAIISNVESGTEQAAILLLLTGDEDRGKGASLRIAKVLLVSREFKIEIAQVLTGEEGDGNRATAFQITLANHRGAQLSEERQITFTTPTITSVISDMLNEIKRLQKEVDLATGEEEFDWIRKYENLITSTRSEGVRPNKAMKQKFESISQSYSRRTSTPTPRPSLSTLFPPPSSSLLASTTGEPLLSPTPSSLSLKSSIKDRWIINRLQEREDEFIEEKERINIWVGTWNVNDKLPGRLEIWVEEAVEKGVEMMVFGFQEFDLTTEAMLYYSPYREELWRTAIEKALGSSRNLYTKLHSKQLVGALSLIYVRRDIAHLIKEVESSSIATGVLGLFANKGATAIRLRYKDTYLTFVNSHLAAHSHQTEQRNQDVTEITKWLNFGEEGQKRDPWLPDLRPDSESPYVGTAGKNLWNSHHLIWMGDLNYRIDLPRSDVLRMIETKEWEMLLRFDQLTIQKEHGLVWSDFEEGKINFPPSFKFDVGTNLYDTSEKQRTPSWTDRIVWLSLREKTIRALSYRSHPELVISDHKPVSAVLSVEVSNVNKEKRSRVQQEIIAQLETFDDAHESPDVRILPGPAVQFDDALCYLEPQTTTIEVHNTGSVLAIWSFTPKPSQTQLCEPWLNISPTNGLILPGQKAIVTLTILIDNSTASSVNFPSTHDNLLSDLLILSIDHKDLFLSVTAREFKPTCFGNSLERVCKLPRAIRLMTAEELLAIREDDGIGRLEIRDKLVPREMLRMLECLIANEAMKVDELFLGEANADLVRMIREDLDTGEPFRMRSVDPPSSDFSTQSPEDPDSLDLGSLQISQPTLTNVDFISSMAECLLQFLNSLTEPVIPFTMYLRALDTNTKDEVFNLVNSLPEVNANTLLHLVAFLKVLLDATEDPVKRTVRGDRLAVAFSSVLLRQDPSSPPPEGLPSTTIPRRRKAFVLKLLRGP